MKRKDITRVGLAILLLLFPLSKTEAQHSSPYITIKNNLLYDILLMSAGIGRCLPTGCMLGGTMTTGTVIGGFMAAMPASGIGSGQKPMPNR